MEGKKEGRKEWSVVIPPPISRADLVRSADNLYDVYNVHNRMFVKNNGLFQKYSYMNTQDLDIAVWGAPSVETLPVGVRKRHPLGARKEHPLGVRREHIAGVPKSVEHLIIYLFI